MGCGVFRIDRHSGSCAASTQRGKPPFRLWVESILLGCHLYQTVNGMEAENAPGVAAVADVLANCAVNAMLPLASTLGALVFPDNRVP